MQIHGSLGDTQTLLFAGGGFISPGACHQCHSQSRGGKFVIPGGTGHALQNFFCGGQVTFLQSVFYHVVTPAAVGSGDMFGRQIRTVESIIHAAHAQQSFGTALAGQFLLQLHVGILHSVPLLICCVEVFIVNLVSFQKSGNQFGFRVGVAVFILSGGEAVGPGMVGGRGSSGEQGIHALHDVPVCLAVSHEPHLTTGGNLVADVQIEQ